MHKILSPFLKKTKEIIGLEKQTKITEKLLCIAGKGNLVQQAALPCSPQNALTEKQNMCICRCPCTFQRGKILRAGNLVLKKIMKIR